MAPPGDIYRARGWDEKGEPAPQKLDELGLPAVD